MPTMSVDNPFALHQQPVWLERSEDPRLDLWLRVAALAFGRHRRNGHANFGAGEMADLLGAAPAAVSRAIREAKARGWIDGESHARCLVVPPHAVRGGLGHPNDPCRIHRRLTSHGNGWALF